MVLSVYPTLHTAYDSHDGLPYVNFHGLSFFFSFLTVLFPCLLFHFTYHPPLLLVFFPMFSFKGPLYTERALQERAYSSEAELRRWTKNRTKVYKNETQKMRGSQ